MHRGESSIMSVSLFTTATYVDNRAVTVFPCPGFQQFGEVL